MVAVTWLLCAFFLDETPCVHLYFEQIAADIHFCHKIVEWCFSLLEPFRDNQNVEFSFKGFGILAVQREAISMTCFADCLLELDVTGSMLAALLGVSLCCRLGSCSWLWGNAIKAVSSCFLLAVVTCLA